MLIKTNKQRTLYIVSKAVLYNTVIMQEVPFSVFFQKSYAVKKAIDLTEEISKESTFKGLKWNCLKNEKDFLLFWVLEAKASLSLKNVPVVFIRKNFVIWK